MGWIRVEDDFYDNDKMLAAGSIARDLYWHGMAFCNRNLTDGLIPRGKALCLADFTDAAMLLGEGGVDGQDCAPIAVQRLLGAGLWHEDGHDCTSCIQPGRRHYIVHDYLKYQPSREQVEAKAEANRERVRQFKERQRSSTEGNAVTNALANAPVTEQLHDTPNPNPNPNNSSLVTKEGEVALGNAREPHTPRPQCSKHPNGTDLPCRGCARVREWDESEAGRLAADELHAKRLARDRAENCPTCHGTNWIPDTEPAIKCTHQLQGAVHA